MALLKNLVDKYGIERSIYWKIINVELPESSILVWLNGYISREAANDTENPKEPISKVAFAFDWDKTEPVSYADIYEKVKQRAEFADAEDVLEEIEVVADEMYEDTTDTADTTTGGAENGN